MQEIEKLISMSLLFDVTIDYILKGETPPTQGDNKHRMASLITSAAATMILLVGIVASFGRFLDTSNAIDIYIGVGIDSVGIMIVMISWFLAGGSVLSKPTFIINVLLSGILPSLLLSQIIMRLKLSSVPYFRPIHFFVFACIYLIICGTTIFFTVVRNNNKILQ